MKKEANGQNIKQKDADLREGCRQQIPQQLRKPQVDGRRGMDEKVSDPKFVVLQDDSGFYATERTRLDSGLADSYRYVGSDYKARLLKELLPGVQVSCQDDKISMKAE